MVYAYSRSQEVDPYNRTNKRNVRNTKRSTYNCGGYALGTFSWFCPNKNIFSYACYAYDTFTEAKENTATAVEYMLKKFSDLRIVNALDEVRPDEYAILFRVSSDGDFHFLKRDRRNHWWHKLGSGRIERIKTKDIFLPWSHGQYAGPIIIMAKKYP